MPARAIGTATVSFGLVSIPLKIYTTSKSSSHISFNMVHPECGTRLKQRLYCPTCEETVERTETAKGYEFSKGQYVVFSNDEIKALEAVASNAIQLTEFVPEDAIDPVYYDKSYYLGPDKGGERAYVLLGEAMKQTGLVALAKYAARGKQYLVLVRPFEDSGLIMHQLRYPEELRGFDEVPHDEDVEVADAELKLAEQIIEQIAADEFHPENYKDEVKARVLELIDQKIEGQEITAAPEAPQGQIIDLMEALKASLAAKGKGAAAGGEGKAKTKKAKAPAKKKSASSKESSSSSKKSSSRKKKAAK